MEAIKKVNTLTPRKPEKWKATSNCYQIYP